LTESHRNGLAAPRDRAVLATGHRHFVASLSFCFQGAMSMNPMTLEITPSRARFCGLPISLAALAVLLATAPAHAQAPTPEAPAAEPAPATPPPAPLPAPTAQIELTATETAPPPPPDVAPLTTPTESMPSTATEKKLPPIGVAVWIRSDVTFQGQGDPEKLNDQTFTPYGELHAGGKIHDNVSVTLNLNGGGVGGGFGIEDAIIGFDIMDEFHIWVGQLLVPVDRANYAGPFFAIPWNYTGAIGFVPHEGPSGRNAGLSVWGDLMGGKFKYVLGAFDGGGDAESVLYSARLQADFIGEEPGYFGNATYFGEKDIVALGLGGQYQKDGEAGPDGATDDYNEFNADLLAEFKLGAGAWVTGEAGVYVTGGDYPGFAKTAFYVTAAYATPKIGVGNIQPMLRYQMGSGEGDAKTWSIDAAVSYLIMGPALRLVGNFQHVDTDAGTGTSVKANSLTLGAQAIFF
jgi:hypothetical protein